MKKVTLRCEIVVDIALIDSDTVKCAEAKRTFMLDKHVQWGTTPELLDDHELGRLDPERN